MRRPVLLPVLLQLHPAPEVPDQRRRVVRRRAVQWRVVRRWEVASPARRGVRVVHASRVAHDRAPRPKRRGAGAEPHPERRDLFLCHAWDDRNGAARELCDLLVSLGATVWFSENEVGLGKSLLREIDRGLATSRIGIVLVTPALLESLAAQGVADKELSALLATDRVIPVAHGTTFESSGT